MWLWQSAVEMHPCDHWDCPTPCQSRVFLLLSPSIMNNLVILCPRMNGRVAKKFGYFGSWSVKHRNALAGTIKLLPIRPSICPSCDLLANKAILLNSVDLWYGTTETAVTFITIIYHSWNSYFSAFKATQHYYSIWGKVLPLASADCWLIF